MIAVTSSGTTGPPAVDTLRLLAGWADTGGPAGLAEHLARYGPVPVGAFPGRAGQRRLIDVVAAAGLRGRGGAGFPMARKLAAVATERGRRVVVANGCEGDPASAKDTALLDLAPHLVIDGLVLAAHAVGAAEAILCVHEGGGLARAMSAAVHDRGGSVAIRVVQVPPRYVASESSALVNFLTTGDARPTVTPPRAAHRGVRGRPTLVANVETLAHLALIARFGADWFRVAGTETSAGTALVTVGGAVTWPGVYEIEFGTPVGEVLDLAGGASEPLQAVQIGGLGGSWLPAELAAGLPLAHEAGVGLGVAALVALPSRACGIVETAKVVAYLAAESAGQCGPCMFGLPAVARDLAELAGGDGAALDRLQRRLGVIPGRGACAHPDGAVRLTVTALEVFADDAREHSRGRPCAWAGEPSWMPVPGVARQPGSQP